MDDRDLPGPVRAKVEALRAKPKYAHLVDIVLKKRDAAPVEERARYERMLLELDKPSSYKWVFLLALPFGGLGFFAYSEHAYDEKVEAGIPTLARVKRLDEGFCWIGLEKHECMQLTVEVHGAKGAPYEAVFTRDIGVQWMSRIQPGSWLTVSVDAADATQVYFDERSMAVPAPTPP